jgi:hypothetical protein
MYKRIKKKRGRNHLNVTLRLRNLLDHGRWNFEDHKQNSGGIVSFPTAVRPGEMMWVPID